MNGAHRVYRVEVNKYDLTEIFYFQCSSISNGESADIEDDITTEALALKVVDAVILVTFSSLTF